MKVLADIKSKSVLLKWPVVLLVRLFSCRFDCRAVAVCVVLLVDKQNQESQWDGVFNMRCMRQHVKVFASPIAGLQQFLIIWERNKKSRKCYMYVFTHIRIKAPIKSYLKCGCCLGACVFQSSPHSLVAALCLQALPLLPLTSH